MTLAEARAMYFARNGFGDDGGYTKRWVTFKLGPFPVGFPNTAGRKRAVRFHDLHHVVTAYPTTTAGEGMIGSWEIATGCRALPVAWMLNFTGFSAGLVLAPRAVYRAWVRGRHTKNLYGDDFGDALLAETVATARARLGLDGGAPVPTLADNVSFAAMAVAGVVALVGFWSVFAIPTLVAMAVFLIVQGAMAAGRAVAGRG